MTQITNVMFIMLIAITMSIVVTFFTYIFDISVDVPSLIKSIPHLILNYHFNLGWSFSNFV